MLVTCRFDSLTLTPIVCYFAKATGVDPMPFLFAEYAAANTFGALLYTGNPTNIIVADAYNMTFLGYSKFMTLPTFGGYCVRSTDWAPDKTCLNSWQLFFLDDRT